MSIHEGEGWHGKSIREHVEAAQGVASEALDLVQSLREELNDALERIEGLRAEIEIFRSTDQ